MNTDGTSRDSGAMWPRKVRKAADSELRSTSIDSLLRASTASEYALIRVLAIAERRQLDPAMLVGQLAGDFPGGSGQRMMQFTSLLSQGYPVVDSLQLVHGVLHPSLVIALRLSHEAGVLSQMYETLLAESEGDDSQASEYVGRLGTDLLRVVFVFLFAGAVAAFIAVAILPTFMQMFEEFELALPQLMLITISLSNHVTLFLTLGMLFVVALLIWRAPLIVISLRSRLSPSAAGERFIAPSASLLSLLSVAAQTGRPLASVFATLARDHPDAGTRRRLHAAVARINSGEDPWRCLAAEGLISRREASSLSLASSGRTQAVLLRWRAVLRQNRHALRTHVVVRLFSILATLSLAIFVGLLAISVFLVLSSLIAGLS